MPRLTSFNCLAFALLLTSNLVLAQDAFTSESLQKRDYDSDKIFNRKRNAHACIMSIVVCVLFPLGGISIHLPISSIPFLRNTYLVKKVTAIHAPIQLLGLVMLIGGFALGIRIAHDIGYFSSYEKVPAHMIIGFIVVLTIILFQPLLGMLQHRYFKKNGRTSMFGYGHRWIGRVAIILGIINSGLGLDLAHDNGIVVKTESYLRNFLLAGVLCLIWLGLGIWDGFFNKGVPAEHEEPKLGREVNA